MRKKPELLAPAGNYEKFETAVRYGADAVYLAGQMFGMRAAADNFTLDGIERAAEYAHDPRCQGICHRKYDAACGGIPCPVRLS